LDLGKTLSYSASHPYQSCLQMELKLCLVGEGLTLTVKTGSVTIRVETYGSNRDCVGTIRKLRICQVSGLVRFRITQVILYIKKIKILK